MSQYPAPHWVWLEQPPELELVGGGVGGGGVGPGPQLLGQAPSTGSLYCAQPAQVKQSLLVSQYWLEVHWEWLAQPLEDPPPAELVGGGGGLGVLCGGRVGGGAAYAIR